MTNEEELQFSAMLAQTLVARAYAEAALFTLASQVPGAGAVMAEMLDLTLVKFQQMPSAAGATAVSRALAIRDIAETQNALRQRYASGPEKAARKPPS